jgi:hypothetical protein
VNLRRTGANRVTATGPANSVAASTEFTLPQEAGQAGFAVSAGGVSTATFVAPTVTCASTTGVQQVRFGVVAPQINSTVTEFAQRDTAREYQVNGTKVLITASRYSRGAFDLFFQANA